jgi:hypothetical protein
MESKISLNKILEMVRSIRKWLIENKIFFDTIVAVLLSIMAIVVAFGAYQIAQKQTALIEKEHLPVFSLRIDPICPQDYTDDDFCPDDRLTIVNLGDPITQFIVDPKIFLVAQNNRSNLIYIPVANYYKVYTIPTNATLNTWQSSDNHGSYGRFIALNKNFSQYSESKGYNVSLDLKRYLVLEYFDYWGDKRDDYYFIDTHQYIPLSETEIKEIDNNYKKSYPSDRYPLSFREFYSNKTYDDWLHALERKGYF